MQSQYSNQEYQAQIASMKTELLRLRGKYLVP
jgi:ribosomal protein L29